MCMQACVSAYRSVNWVFVPLASVCVQHPPQRPRRPLPPHQNSVVCVYGYVCMHVMYVCFYIYACTYPIARAHKYAPFHVSHQAGAICPFTRRENMVSNTVLWYDGTEHGCKLRHGQCYWSSEQEAKIRCSSWDLCQSIYCSTQHNDEGNLECYARKGKADATLDGDTSFDKNCPGAYNAFASVCMVMCILFPTQLYVCTLVCSVRCGECQELQ